MNWSNGELTRYASIGREGNCPVILVASHSGRGLPRTVPDRSHLIQPGESLLPDLGTGKLVLSVATHMHAAGMGPYQVITRLSRCKVDFNRPPGRAYVGAGKQFYNHFHSMVEGFLARILATHSFALLVDVHGFDSAGPHIARAYDVILGTKNGLTMSLQDEEGISRLGFAERLRRAGWRVYPEGLNPEDTLWGGYIIVHYGRRDRTRAIQLEVSSRIRKDHVLCDAFARDMSTVLVELVSCGRGSGLAAATGRIEEENG